MLEVGDSLQRPLNMLNSCFTIQLKRKTFLYIYIVEAIDLKN